MRTKLFTVYLNYIADIWEHFDIIGLRATFIWECNFKVTNCDFKKTTRKRITLNVINIILEYELNFYLDDGYLYTNCMITMLFQK